MSLKKFLLYLLINLNLIVSQNKQISVGNVKFIGNNNLSNKALLKQVELKTSSLFRFSDIDFDRRLLKLDAISIKNLYNSYGFLEATVKDSFKIVDQSADIFFIVNEGKQYFLNAIEINLDDIACFSNCASIIPLTLYFIPWQKGIQTKAALYIKHS